MLFIMLAALISAAWPLSDAYAQGDPIEVTIQGDGSAMKDTYIASSAPTTNNGSATVFAVGENNTASSVARGLLQFDLSGLPNDLTVVSATLSLWVSADHSNNARLMSAYAIRPGRDWVETQATWNIFKTSNNWGTAGAGNTTSDIIGTSIGSVSVANNLTAGTQVDIVLDPAAVQSMRWLDYYGFELQMATEVDDRYDFVSSDNATSGQRPRLVIEYYPDTPTPDPGWKCYEGQNGGEILYNWPDCAPGGTAVPPVMSPYIAAGDAITTASVGGFVVNESAATLQCTPYPQCVNNFPIYYRLTYEANWTKGGGALDSTFHTDLIILGAASVALTADCGSGNNGHCLGIFTGTIPTTSLPVNQDGGYTLGVQSYFTWSGIVGSMTHREIDWTLYFSLQPFDEDCADTWFAPVVDTYEIDPTIETPVGPTTDYQIYPTVIGTRYAVHVQDGPWNNGTIDKTDAAVSLDGSTWFSFADFEALAFCVDVDETNPDYNVIYFIATTTTFYIRVNDTAGAFANNTNDGDTPYQYVIGVALAIDDAECGDQFTFDDEADLISTIEIDSTISYAQTPKSITDETDPLIFQVGEWYGIEVVSGTWHEPAGLPSIAMQYDFAAVLSVEWEDLAEGSSLVGCVINTDRDIVFVQADFEQLLLRVDDQDLNWANNTGTLEVNIYHVAYDRKADACELAFALDDIVRSDSVDATQDNGKVFGGAVGSTLVNNNTQPENFLSYGLVPGAFYALETTGGPWIFSSSASNPLRGKSWALQVAEESFGSIATTPEDDWGLLADWDLAVCNIQTDPLGHRLIYFQVPPTSTKQWKLRVDDEFGWPFKTGSMSWNLYRVIDLGPEQSGVCDYTYDPEDIVNSTVQTVRGDAANGAYMNLLPDTYYAIELLGEDYQWFEQAADDPGTPRIDMELSLNSGQTWGDLPGFGALCSLEDGDNTIFFLHTGLSAPLFKLRVNSTSFENNTGMMGYNIYVATAGSSINPFDTCVTAGYSTSVFGPIEWIPVKDPTGRGITSTSASYAEIAGLVPGQKYIVETNRGGWTDGETETERFGAQVSSDDGATWQEMDGTNTDIDCWEGTPDWKYRKIEFTVQPGQSWRIRVADTETATFEDNEGNLAYTLKGEVLPADTMVNGTFSLAGCNTPPIFPGLLDVSELLNLGNYLAEWMDYVSGIVIKFFAWCPENTAAVTMFASDINTRDPFAAIAEFRSVLNDIKNDINGYSWGGSGTDYSILDKSPAESAQMINQYVFGPLPADSPWMGGELLPNFGDAPDPNIYEDSCELSVNDYIGPSLAKGVCFASNWARETGLTFWAQLLLDVGVASMCISSVFNTLASLMYLFTGVNFGTRGSRA